MKTFSFSDFLLAMDFCKSQHDLFTAQANTLIDRIDKLQETKPWGFVQNILTGSSRSGSDAEEVKTVTEKLEKLKIVTRFAISSANSLAKAFTGHGLHIIDEVDQPGHKGIWVNVDTYFESQVIKAGRITKLFNHPLLTTYANQYEDSVLHNTMQQDFIAHGKMANEFYMTRYAIRAILLKSGISLNPHTFCDGAIAQAHLLPAIQQYDEFLETLYSINVGMSFTKEELIHDYNYPTCD